MCLQSTALCLGVDTKHLNNPELNPKSELIFSPNVFISVFIWDFVSIASVNLGKPSLMYQTTQASYIPQAGRRILLMSLIRLIWSQGYGVMVLHQKTKSSNMAMFKSQVKSNFFCKMIVNHYEAFNVFLKPMKLTNVNVNKCIYSCYL